MEQSFLIFLAAIVVISELFKARFEKSEESKDERGQLIILKTKSMSYNYLTVGIIAGFLLVGLIEVMPIDIFPFYVLLVFLLQSVISAIYLGVIRKKQL